MRFLVRQDEPHAQTHSNEAPEGRIDAIRVEGSQLLSAADEAIQRALAGGNSETFLRAGRQQGGE
jgi:hypothetical protein